MGYDPIVSAEEAASFGIEYHLLDEMWPLVDFVTIHTPLLPHLRGMSCQLIHLPYLLFLVSNDKGRERNIMYIEI